MNINLIENKRLNLIDLKAKALSQSRSYRTLFSVQILLPNYYYPKITFYQYCSFIV